MNGDDKWMWIALAMLGVCGVAWHWIDVAHGVVK